MTQQLIQGDVEGLRQFLKDHPNQFFTGRELCAMFGFPLTSDRRALRLAIEDLFLFGAPIVYNNHDGKKGYAWATDRQLFLRCKADLRAKIESMQRHVDRLDAAQYRMGVL